MHLLLLNHGCKLCVHTQMCGVMNKMAETYIRWPTSAAELNNLSTGFTFPWTVGAIDGTHIRIKQPLTHIDSYTNRKSYTSVVVQAVCDSRMSFLNISVDWPGSMHDARIYRRSSIGIQLDRDGLHPYHLLGDSAYPLISYLFVPFRDDGHLCPEQKQFNNAHSASRIVVEQSFARLKGKWRRMKHLDMENLHLMSRVITAAFVLHNFIIAHDGTGTSDCTNRGFCNTAADALNFRLSPADRRQELMYLAA